MNLLCMFGIHKWETVFSDFTSICLFDRCVRCGVKSYDSNPDSRPKFSLFKKSSPRVYIYDFGYSTEEGSHYTQLEHFQRFSRARFEEMLLDCVVRAAQMEYDKTWRQWRVDALACCDSNNNDDCDDDCSGGMQKYYLELAMRCRVEGDERGYLRNIVEAMGVPHIFLDYGHLHGSVVSLVCDLYGFSILKFAEHINFYGWQDLASDCSSGRIGITSRACDLVKAKLVTDGSSAESKFKAEQREAMGENPASCDLVDEKFCNDLGVEFIPYSHPLALENRNKLKDSDSEEFVIEGFN